MLLLLFSGFGSGGIAPAPIVVTKKVGWIAAERQKARNTIKPKQLDKIFASRRSWPTDINRAYGRIQDNIDTIEEMTPLESAQEELAWLIAKRNNSTNRREIELLGRRINELYTEIYRLQLIEELKQQKH